MLTLFRLAGLYLKISALNELQYRANFFAAITQTALSLITVLFGLAVVYDHTDEVNGWNSGELLCVVGVYFIIGGLVSMVIQPSMQRLTEEVRLGTLDFVLLKPVDSQIQISIRALQLWEIAQVVAGIVILGVGLGQIGRVVTLAQVGAFGLMMLTAVVIVYSFWLILATSSFWLVRIDNMTEIFQSMYEAGRWPVRIYPGWLQILLTFLVPIAFAVTVPAEALTGRLTTETAAGALLVAGLMVAGSRAFWQYGVRHYGGASA